MVRERKTPSEIKADEKNLVSSRAKDAFLQIREDAAKYGNQDLSDEEINTLINEVRNAKK